MKIDLHVHLEHRPYRYARRVIQQAKEIGVDAVCLTEHNAETPPVYFEDLRKDIDIPVFWASEYSSNQGHILVFMPGEKVTYKENWQSMQEIIDMANSAGGVAIPAHPYTSTHSIPLGDGVFDLKGLTAIETINGSLAAESNMLAEAARSRLGIKGIGGSDAHNEFMVGRAFTIFRKQIKTMVDLINELKTGRYSAAKNDLTIISQEG